MSRGSQVETDERREEGTDDRSLVGNAFVGSALFATPRLCVLALTSPTAMPAPRLCMAGTECARAHVCPFARRGGDSGRVPAVWPGPSLANRRHVNLSILPPGQDIGWLRLRITLGSAIQPGIATPGIVDAWRGDGRVTLLSALASMVLGRRARVGEIFAH